MNTLEMTSILRDLKENYQVTGIKAEFEDEGTRFDEALKLKELASHVGLNLTIKIGGCGAVRDIYEAKNLGAETVIAPMIESLYAVKKYFQALNSVYDANFPKFMINIETKTGFECLDEILNSEYSKNLSGIVLGRTDFAGSLGLSQDEVECEKIFNYVKSVSLKTFENNKEFVIGGGISPLSLPFLRNLPAKYLSRFETRKVIFEAQKALENPNIDKGIKKALEFELLWIKYRREHFAIFYKEDETRLKTLMNRCK